jgi:hypothetical protein
MGGPELNYACDLHAAVQALNPQAVPLIGALVRDGCVVVHETSRAQLLALLATLGDSVPFDGPSAAQMATLAAYRGSDEAWGWLQRHGQLAAAHGAVMFAMFAASARIDLLKAICESGMEQ